MTALIPAPYRVAATREETADTQTLELVPVEGERIPYEPGQFTMVYAFGAGEVPISISGNPGVAGPLVHTVRAVGPTTEMLCGLSVGDEVGIRGPFGRGWPGPGREADDLVLVAGGLGLAPLRPMLYRALAERPSFRRLILLYGGREPDQLLFRDELDQWLGREDLECEVIVDVAHPAWRGRVGVVPSLIDRLELDPERTIALVCGPEVMMRYAAAALLELGVAPAAPAPLARAEHALRRRPLRALSVGELVHLPGWPGARLGDRRPADRGARAVSAPAKPKLAVWKFTSCDGCQLQILNLEDELLALADAVQIAHFTEATRANLGGPYEISIVEGSISTPEEIERIHGIREASSTLIAIGACASAGGIQALRNFARLDETLSAVYATPEYVSALERSMPISSHVEVDFELQGCPPTPPSCSRCWVPTSRTGGRGSARARSAWSARNGATPASWSPGEPPASAR